ncbi:HipA N-terminal domain-containing protein [Halopseudomonas pachastrellae]|nr:HipA N-terminal domain-containing protein [Halopseudomonas pachastrellae]
MILDVHVSSRLVAKLYRERDEYVLRYLPDARSEDFVSLTMPVREEAWRWPRDLFPFFRQNLPEGYLLASSARNLAHYLTALTYRCLPWGAAGIGRVSVTPEGVLPDSEIEPLEISHLLTAENTTEHFAQTGAPIRSGSCIWRSAEVHSFRRRA